MHSDSQSLEASFEPAAGRPDSASPIAADPVVEDFNAFFERLSALDNLQWSAAAPGANAGPGANDAPQRPAAPADAAPGTAATAATAPRRRPAPRRQAAAAKPRMTVVKSETDLGAPPAADVPDPDAVRAVARGRITARDVARFLKLTLVGLMLFALGLGAGWAALSLPGHFDPASANFTELMERTRAMALAGAGNGKAASAGARKDIAGAAPDTTGAADHPAPADRLRLVESGAGAKNASAPATTGQPGRTAATAPTVANTAASTAASTGANTVASIGPAGGVPSGGLPSNGADTDTGEPETGFVMPGPEAPAAPSAPSAPATAGSTAVAERTAEPTAAAGGAARFTLQVGACSSFACVENYRHLLMKTVRPGAIKVVSQPGAGGSPAIQRIRVQPLERDEAERLKATLAAQDARFTDAYVIALR